MRSSPEQNAIRHTEEPEKARSVSIPLSDGQQVSGLLQEASTPRSCYVVAHGAGAGMTHPFLAGVANGLKDRQVCVLRYQFPYMEKGSKRPDVPAVAHAAVRAAVAEAARLLPGIALFAGGNRSAAA